MAGRLIFFAIENDTGDAIARNDETVIGTSVQPCNHLACGIHGNKRLRRADRDSGRDRRAWRRYRSGYTVHCSFQPRRAGGINIDCPGRDYLIDEDAQRGRTHARPGSAGREFRQVELEQTF